VFVPVSTGAKIIKIDQEMRELKISGFLMKHRVGWGAIAPKTSPCNIV